MSEVVETSGEAQSLELLNGLIAKPCTPVFYAENYEIIRASILAGMGIEKFDHALADRLESAIKNGLVELWILFEPSEDTPRFCGSLTFFIATDVLLATKYLYIYSLHCSKKVPLEAWRQPFITLFRHAEQAGCKVIWGRTVLPHVEEIARDNGFTVSAHLERTV
jgi:hypothetical protein